MALSISVDKVDENGKEILTYGTKEFPIAFFDDDLTNVLVPWHWHDELEIVLIIEGTVSMKIAGREFELNAGEGYFANSSILHSAELKTHSGYQHALVFSPKIISQAADLVWKTCVDPVLNNPEIPFVRLDPVINWQKEIIGLSEKAWESGAYEKEFYPLTVRESLTHVLFILSEHTESNENKSFNSQKELQDEFRAKKTLSYIEKNYTSPITINDIAKSADISVSTCLRLFKEVLHTTPINFLIKFRLQKAIQILISDPQKAISEAAFQCGFSDASYFNRCFRKEYKTTPTEYLKRIH